MSPRGRRILLGLVAVGVLARLALAFKTYGSLYDISSFGFVDKVLRDDPLHLYSTVNQELRREVHAVLFHYPYPPAYLPWVPVAAKLATLSGLPFHGWIQVPPILGDAGLAWLIQYGLGVAGADERTRIAGFALVMLGPVFVAISGYHGQFDSLAVLPLVAALLVWERPDVRNRALVAGLLVGLGGAFKTAPLLMLLALLPTARGIREAFTLVGTAVAVPLTLLIPFAIADPDGVWQLHEYQGAPGQGGLSLLLQPDLAARWLGTADIHYSEVTKVLLLHGGVISGPILLAVCAVMWRLRLPPRTAAVVLWLSFYVFGTGFFFHYLVWGVPFLILAGHLRAAAAVQVAVLLPLLLFYRAPWESDAAAVVYAIVMLAIWVGMVVGLAVVARRAVAEARAGPGAAPA